MGAYTRKDSPYYWLYITRPGQKPLQENTRILVDAPTKWQRDQQRDSAKAAYAARLLELARHRYQLPSDRPARRFDEHAGWYEANVTAHKRGADREREILKGLTAWFGTTLLAEVSRARVIEWRTARSEKVAVGTVNRELDVLKHLLATAVPDYLEESPIAGLERLRHSKEKPAATARAMTPDEERKLLKVLESRDRVLVVLALDTLVRLNDALHLTWADDHGQYLRARDTKTGSTYEVPVSRRLRRALNELPRDERPIFWHRRLAENPRDWRGSVRQMLEYACEAAGVRYGRKVGGVTWHCLRHTGASRMVEAGTDLRTVQEIGGWASLRQLSRYAHPTHAAMTAAVESVGKRRAAVGPPKRKGAKPRGKTRKPTKARVQRKGRLH